MDIVYNFKVHISQKQFSNFFYFGMKLLSVKVIFEEGAHRFLTGVKWGKWNISLTIAHRADDNYDPFGVYYTSITQV